MFAKNTPDSNPAYTDCKHDSTQLIAVPHLAWNGEQFQRSSPEPPLSVTMEIAMMTGTHAAFSCIPTNTVSHKSHHIPAFADTGAQTCSSGPEIQRLLGYPDGYLMPTIHRIRGITNNRFHVKSVLFLRVRVASKETRHVVFVADNTSGLYLLQNALKDLDVAPWFSIPGIT